MAHMRVLCQEIGPRPPTSPQERQAAEYVQSVLQQLGITDRQVQPFLSHTTFGWLVIPNSLAGVLALLVAWVGGPVGKLIGGLVFLIGVSIVREVLLSRLPFYRRWIARGRSQNVIARIPPTGQVKQQVFLIGHLDSQKQRFFSPLSKIEWMKVVTTLSLLAPALLGLSFLADFLLQNPGIAWWQWLLGLAFLSTVPGLCFDEIQPTVEGANDNATAVAVLLGVAETLRAHPLQQTAVTLLFTGCEEVMCVGMERYLEQFQPPKQETVWIDLEMVGTGNLCYVTRHGMSHFTEYAPGREMVRLVAGVAQRHPELAVTGREMLIVEEVATLRSRGYNAIAIAGYNDKGFLPNWHRLSDRLEQIEPETLSRAACYTWALIQEVDNTYR